MPELLSVSEVAERLGHSKTGVTHWIRRGRIVAHKEEATGQWLVNWPLEAPEDVANRLSITEAARVANRSREVVYKWINRGVETPIGNLKLEVSDRRVSLQDLRIFLLLAGKGEES